MNVLGNMRLGLRKIFGSNEELQDLAFYNKWMILKKLYLVSWNSSIMARDRSLPMKQGIWVERSVC